MLFNSQFFIFVFLPVALVVYFALGRLSRIWALRWIIVASLIFYGWWRPANLLIIVPALIVNFGFATAIARLRDAGSTARSRAVLVIGIVFNVALLGYFKYANFALTATNDVFGTHFAMREIVLPLGISFITFQKIAFLIDVYGKRVETFRFHDFCSFVLFFPQLIAGPIVHYREMMPQFHSADCTWNRDHVAVGMSMFVFGLFKKVCLADGIAPMVSSIYASAASGDTISLLPAWLAAIGFTFQIYFDFSGYTDMALGAARMFGIKLPVNFNSPLKSSSIIDFWLRWHVSLTRFLTAYLYNPIALALTRRRMQAGKDSYGGRNTSVGAFVQLLMLPTILTMFISGLWHGAGYLFIAWGVLHGVYLTINHGWRLFALKRWGRSERYTRVMRPVGFVLTFVAVAVSMVVFRATTADAALGIIGGMFGQHGLVLPDSVFARLPGIVGAVGIHGGLENLGNLVPLAGWLVLLAPVVFLAPNTLQIMERFEPAIGVKPADAPNLLGRMRLNWRSSPAWALVVAGVGWLAILNIGGYSEFLYWQF